MAEQKSDSGSTRKVQQPSTAGNPSKKRKGDIDLPSRARYTPKPVAPATPDDTQRATPGESPVERAGERAGETPAAYRRARATE